MGIARSILFPVGLEGDISLKKGVRFRVSGLIGDFRMRIAEYLSADLSAIFVEDLPARHFGGLRRFVFVLKNNNRQVHAVD